MYVYRRQGENRCVIKTSLLYFAGEKRKNISTIVYYVVYLPQGTNQAHRDLFL